MKLKEGMRLKENGSIEYRFVVDGKRYSVTAKTVKGVLKKEQEKRVQIETKTYKKNSSITFDSYFNELMDRKKSIIKESTVFSYKKYYKKWVKGKIGSEKIGNIERRQIINLHAYVKDNMSPETANLVLKILRTVFNDACTDEVIQKNPSENIKFFKVDKKKAANTIHRALTKEEQKLFFDNIKCEWNYETFAFQVLTGMRIGEVCALEWSDIDYKNNTIHITKTVTKDIDGNDIITSPKTESSIRDIPMNDAIKDIIAKQRKKVCAKYPIGIHTHIFVSARNNMQTSQSAAVSLNVMLKHLAEKNIKIEKFSTHAFRDTFATRYIEQGGNMQTLKTILGHSSLAMTMDLYAHVLPDTKQEEMNRIEIMV